MINAPTKREQILNIAYKIFNTKGIQALTVEAIREQSNFSTEDICSEFSSLDTLKSNIISKAIIEIQASLFTRAPYSTITDLDTVFIELASNKPGWSKTILNHEIKNNTFLEQLSDITSIYLPFTKISTLKKNWLKVANLLLNTDFSNFHLQAIKPTLLAV